MNKPKKSLGKLKLGRYRVHQLRSWHLWANRKVFQRRSSAVQESICSFSILRRHTSQKKSNRPGQDSIAR